MSLEEINQLLVAAARILDDAADRIARSQLQPSGEHVGHIGEALLKIFAVQQAIYAVRPDLTPQFLKEPSPFPAGEGRRFGEALIDSDELARAGSVAEALKTWREYLRTNPPAFFREMAEAHLRRLAESE